jgi:tRNA-dihydrouridine synthase
MITLHARFAKQGFEGEADWRLISQLREAVTVPLIGNGDVKTPDDALKMLRETGCDGVMVGRAAISNPWALNRIRAAMVGEPEPAEPTLDERIRIAMEHLRSMVEYETAADLGPPSPELRACRALRGQIPMYIKGFPGAAVARERLTRCSSVDEFEDVLAGFAASAPLESA